LKAQQAGGHACSKKWSLICSRVSLYGEIKTFVAAIKKSRCRNIPHCRPLRGDQQVSKCQPVDTFVHPHLSSPLFQKLIFSGSQTIRRDPNISSVGRTIAFIEPVVRFAYYEEERRSASRRKNEKAVFREPSAHGAV
jgi:hypothetical protein